MNLIRIKRKIKIQKKEKLAKIVGNASVGVAGWYITNLWIIKCDEHEHIQLLIECNKFSVLWMVKRPAKEKKNDQNKTFEHILFNDAASIRLNEQA